MAKEITTSQPLQPKTVNCAVCSNSGNQYQRHLHWLKFPDEGSLVGHWREQYSTEEWLVLQQDGTIPARIGWRRSIEASYRNVADEETGQKLPVWEAWVKSNQAAAAAREKGEAEPQVKREPGPLAPMLAELHELIKKRQHPGA